MIWVGFVVFSQKAAIRHSSDRGFLYMVHIRYRGSHLRAVTRGMLAFHVCVADLLTSSSMFGDMRSVSSVDRLLAAKSLLRLSQHYLR